jgi:hypothetical protein
MSYLHGREQQEVAMSYLFLSIDAFATECQPRDHWPAPPARYQFAAVLGVLSVLVGLTLIS